MVLGVSDQPVDDLVGTSVRSAGLATLAAVGFAAFIEQSRGAEAALQFCAGYLIEQSLSVDNLLVFLVLFEYFRVPPGASQQKALAYGLYGAVICRGVFVLLGYEFINNFRGALLIFAGILVFASVKLLLFEDSDDEDSDDLSGNLVVQLVNKQNFLPVSEKLDGANFFTTGADGIRKATPLLAAVVCLELSDVVFAVDSVPAVFAVSTDPFIVYSSNLFAILGLRAWYSLLAAATAKLPYLDKAVALVLGFVGCKIAASYFGFELDTATSLAIVALLLAGGVATSLAFPKDDSIDV